MCKRTIYLLQAREKLGGINKSVSGSINCIVGVGLENDQSSNSLR